MSQWVALRLLFEVCARGKWYKGGGQRREAWWRHEASEKQVWATLADSQKDKRRSIGGEMGRWARIRNQRGEGRRVGKSACWDGDERLPGG